VASAEAAVVTVVAVAAAAAAALVARWQHSKVVVLELVCRLMMA
jgi:hypothetical protein